MWKSAVTGNAFLSSSPDGAHSDESSPDASQAIYAEFDDDFEDDEIAVSIGNCTAMYNFPGTWITLHLFLSCKFTVERNQLILLEKQNVQNTLRKSALH